MSRKDPSAIQYTATQQPQQIMEGSYFVRMQDSADHSRDTRISDRSSQQRPSIALQKPTKHVPHIAMLSKQDAKGNSRSRTQNSPRGMEYDQDLEPVAIRTKKSDPGRLRNMLQRNSDNLSSASQAPTMEALTMAIRNGLKPGESLQRPEPVRTRTDPMVRLPFQEDPDSPSSMYTDVTTSQARPQSVPLSTYQGYDPRDSRPSTIHEHEFEDYDRSGIETELPTPNSVNPIFAHEHPGMSSKIPASKRPPKLDIGAVREMESRGSITSLPDLIRRATRLATNLDKGKTASRLGLLDFFGSNDKLGDHDRRNSSFSEVLDSFPVAGTPNPDRPTTMWPDGQKQVTSQPRMVVQEKSERPEKKQQRRCCGMSPMWFSVSLVALLLLVAAAVLIPVFLIVLPRQRAQTDPNRCSTSHPCSNGGQSVLINNVCSCICVNGFTGNTCTATRDPGCTTYDFDTGIDNVNNATIGSSVLSVLESSQGTFNINLNQTKLLTTFANTNLSCTSENSLVEFDSGATVRSKRYVMVPGMMSTDQHVPALNLPAAESGEHTLFEIFNEAEDELEHLGVATQAVRQRDNTISSNGIVFATSTNLAAQPSTTQSGVVATATASASPTTPSSISENQTKFAGLVVLYVLQTFEQINVAVAANQAIASYFKATGHKNSTVEVVSGTQRIDADFDKMQILLANGTVLGNS